MYVIYKHPDFELSLARKCFQQYTEKQAANLNIGDIAWADVELDPDVFGFSRVTVKSKGCSLPAIFEGKGHNGWFNAQNKPYRISNYNGLLSIVEEAGPKIATRDCLIQTPEEIETVIRMQGRPEIERLYNSLVELIKREGNL